MIIVTQNQYLLASKIHHITLDECIRFVDFHDEKGRNRSFRDVHYVIQVIYSPENVQPNGSGSIRSNDEQRDCSVTIRTAVNAYKVFKDLIQQIREQMPDQLYLDTALERMISSMDLATLASQDEKDKGEEISFPFNTMEKKNDRKPKKVRKPRKAKRRNQTVLRKSKRSN